MPRNLLLEPTSRNLLTEVPAGRNLLTEPEQSVSAVTKPDVEPKQGSAGFGGYPDQIQDEFVDLGPVGISLKAGMKEAFEASTKGTIETIGAIGTGIPLWAIGKLRGTGELLRGHSEERAREVEQDIASSGVQPKTKSGKAAVEMVGKVMDVITWPARLAGETAKDLGYPKAGYLIELGGELATFKMMGEVKGAGSKQLKQRAAAKSVFDKKMSALTEVQKVEVRKIADTKLAGRNIVKEEKKAKLTPMELAYEVQKDIWFKKKDRRLFEADIESRLLKKEIKESLSEPETYQQIAIRSKKGTVKVVDYRRGGHIEAIDQLPLNEQFAKDRSVFPVEDGMITSTGRFVKRPKDKVGNDLEGTDLIGQRVKKSQKIKPELYDEAIQVYIDLKGHPDHLKKYYDTLTPEQKKIVDLSRSLPPEIKAIADKIAQSYETIGKEAMDAEVIRNMLDNYAGRQWDLGPGKSVEAMRKFGTTTGHAKARKLGTILEGWAEGYDLKIKSGTNNLRTYKHEIIRTMADKEFVSELRKIKDLDGKPLLSTQQFEGYVPVQHPNMTVWEWAGKIEEGKTYGKNFFATQDGQLFEKRKLYAPKREAKNVNNILGISKLAEVPGIKGITKFNAITKAWILQSSLFHHLAFMRSHYLPGGFKGKGETPRQAYKSGIESIEKSDPVLLHGVENGLTIGLKQDWSESLLRESTFLGRQLDKVKATKIAKDQITKFREAQADFLFGELGAGLKAKAYLLEFRHQMKKYPDTNPDVVAKRVAALINEDFGGLHLQRIGRNPTAQHIFRLVALAPDWTESNVRTMVKAIANKTGDQAELAMYRRFWGGVVVKGLGVTALANYALSGGDVNQMMNNYKKAWESGNFNWMKIDVTPIYEAFGGDSGQHKYFGTIGHFQDPIKFLVHPIKSAKHKQSVVSGIGFEALSGTDYTGVRSFATLEDLLKEGKTVKWGKGGPIDWDQFPAYALSQIAGTQPIQIQALMQWVAGEQEGFDALSQSIGLRTTTTYEQKRRMKKGLKKLKGFK